MVAVVELQEEPRTGCPGCEALLLLLEGLGFDRHDLELLHDEGEGILLEK